MEHHNLQAARNLLNDMVSLMMATHNATDEATTITEVTATHLRAVTTFELPEEKFITYQIAIELNTLLPAWATA